MKGTYEARKGICLVCAKDDDKERVGPEETFPFLCQLLEIHARSKSDISELSQTDKLTGSGSLF
jgi:hypothetical protein